MSRKLTPSQRKQIISDYKNGIPNEEYRVIDQGNGKYQVRKRESQFKLPPRPVTPPVEKEETEETPEEHDHEEEAYEEDKQYFQRAAVQRNPWERRKLSLC